MCAHYQLGKAHKRAKFNNNMIKDDIEHPGDSIHMDQAVSSIPGRWLKASERSNRQTCASIYIFVDSESKKMFA